MVQNVYVGPDGGRRQLDRVVWLGGGRAWGWGRSAGVLGPRAEASLVLARRLAGTIEKSTPSVSWRFGALRLWLRRGPAGGPLRAQHKHFAPSGRNPITICWQTLRI